MIDPEVGQPDAHSAFIRWLRRHWWRQAPHSLRCWEATHMP